MQASVILIRPQLATNIGAVARVMYNTGFSDLRIVNPKRDFHNEEAYSVSAHAKQILETARMYASLEEAVADLDFVAMTTVRDRDMEKQEDTPETACIKMEAFSHIGIVFGPERTGLFNEELTQANTLIKIPSMDNSSYNLSHAVAIVLYTLFVKKTQNVPEKIKRNNTASSGEISNFLLHVEDLLDEINYFKEANKKKRQMINLKNILTRNIFTKQDIQTLNGVFKKIKSFKNQ